MRPSFTALCITSVVLSSSMGSTLAANFNMGLDAAKKGDYAGALLQWVPLAEQGDTTAQINLGVMYEDGKGVPKNYQTAVKWYKLAAEQGDQRAQINLGLMYAKGKGVKSDNISAHMWWSVAAVNGDEDASSNIAIITKQMRAEDIRKAQKLAHECILRRYKGC